MYNEYLEERLIGMYSLLESNEIVMERLNKDERLVKKMAKRRFLTYLRDTHSDFNPDEIRNAKTQKERDKVIKKYQNDYKQWKKEVYKDLGKHIAIDLTVDFLFDVIFH